MHLFIYLRGLNFLNHFQYNINRSLFALLFCSFSFLPHRLSSSIPPIHFNLPFLNLRRLSSSVPHAFCCNYRNHVLQIVTTLYPLSGLSATLVFFHLSLYQVWQQTNSPTGSLAQPIPSPLYNCILGLLCNSVLIHENYTPVILPLPPVH